MKVAIYVRVSTDEQDLKNQLELCHCLQGGQDCGLKRHHDISERVKRIEESKK